MLQDLTILWILTVWNHDKRRRIIYEIFLEPLQKLKVIYLDDLLKFGKSCEELSWNHHFIAQKQEIAERAVYYCNLD